MCDELAGRFVLCVASAPDVVATLCRAECSHVLWTFCGRSVDVRSLVGQRQFGHVTMRIETAQDLRVRLPRRSLRHETQSGEGRTRSLRAESTRTPSPIRADAGNLSGTQEGECNGLASNKIKNTAIRSLPTQPLFLPMAKQQVMTFTVMRMSAHMYPARPMVTTERVRRSQSQTTHAIATRTDATGPHKRYARCAPSARGYSPVHRVPRPRSDRTNECPLLPRSKCRLMVDHLDD
jgi:hypothetical protein